MGLNNKKEYKVMKGSLTDAARKSKFEGKIDKNKKIFTGRF